MVWIHIKNEKALEVFWERVEERLIDELKVNGFQSMIELNDIGIIVRHKYYGDEAIRYDWSSFRSVFSYSLCGGWMNAFDCEYTMRGLKQE